MKSTPSSCAVDLDLEGALLEGSLSESSFFEGALSLVLSKLAGRPLVAMQVESALEGKIPCFYDETGGFLTGGDLFLSFLVARSVCKRPSLRYVHAREVDGVLCFQVQSSPNMDGSALCLFDASLVEVLCEYAGTARGLITPMYGLLWVSRKKIILQVNSRLFFSIYFDRSTMRLEEKVPEEDLVKIRLELCIGGVELTPEEYSNLRPGFTFKLSDSESVPLLLKTLGIEIGKGRMICSTEGVKVTVDMLKKIPHSELI